MAKLYEIKFPNGKVYIGVTRTKLGTRFASHKYAKYTVGNAIRKYSLDKSSIREIYQGTEEMCYEFETLIVDEVWYKNNNNYNMCVGGIKPVGVSMKGADNPMWKGGSYCVDCGKETRGERCMACYTILESKSLNFCDCGCGKRNSRQGQEYLRGHRPVLGRVCSCGCGERTSGRSTYVIPNHKTRK